MAVPALSTAKAGRISIHRKGAYMNGIWIRGAAAAIAITLVVAALKGRAGGTRETGVQPLAQRGVIDRIDFRPAGFAPDSRYRSGRPPTPSLPSGWRNSASGGVHALRGSPPAFVCDSGADAGNILSPRAAPPCPAASGP
jgi:hypothetical protein